MFSVNSPVLFRTNGRGVTRTLKGIVFAVVKAGKLPVSKALQASVPHGSKPSNRDRYIVKLDKIGTLVWANVATAVGGGEKLPKHSPRTSTPVAKAKTVKVAKPVAKVKHKPVKVAKTKPRSQMTPKEKSVAAGEPQMPPLKKSGGEKPKTTWYGIVDGKVVSVRKVLCPPGFSAIRMTVPTTAETPVPAAPATEPAALPQAAV